MIAISPLSIHYFFKPENETNPVKQFVMSLVTDEDVFTSEITDKSAITLIIIIWSGIFVGVFLVLLTFATGTFYKIANRALRPIRMLNFKMSILVKTNGELNLENTDESMTSYEVLKIYSMFSELMTAKRFAANNFFEKNDAVAIMNYAEAHTVLKDNKTAQGIGLSNIGHIHHRNKKYIKASQSYKSAAQSAFEIMKQETDQQKIKIYMKLYCKRKYYEIITLFKWCIRQVRI